MDEQKKTSNEGEVVEEFTIKRVKNAPAVERKMYRVTAETGIFKNGKAYNQGDEIELDINTAANFKELGEVEDVES